MLLWVSYYVTIVSMSEIETIIAYQAAHGFTNEQMSKHIGMHKISYIRIKMGRAPLNDKFLNKMRRAFPDIFLPLLPTLVSCKVGATTPPTVINRIVKRLQHGRMK